MSIKTYPRTESHQWTWPLHQYSFFNNDVNTAPHVCANPVYTVSTSTRSATDSVTYGANVANWKSAISNGISATTTLSGAKYYLRGGNGIAYAYGIPWKCRSSVCTGRIARDHLVFSDPGMGPNVNADNQAKSRLLSSYISARNSWRGGNFLAEFGETVEMLRHPVKAFYSETWEFAGVVKKLGRVHRIKKDFVKALGNAWLAFSFGVKPLVDDCNDALSAVKELAQGNRSDTMPIRGHGRDTVVEANDIRGITPFQYLGDPHGGHYIRKKDYNVTYRGQIAARPLGGSQIAEEFGIGVFDVIPAVWEAIPWSFFVDYFTNVQEMVDSMRYATADVRWLYSSVRNSGVIQFTGPVRLSTLGTYNSGVTFDNAHSLAVRVNRAPLSAMPYPGWHFKIPGISSQKWYNVAALAAQFRGSKNLPFLG